MRRHRDQVETPSGPVLPHFQSQTALPASDIDYDLSLVFCLLKLGYDTVKGVARPLPDLRVESLVILAGEYAYQVEVLLVLLEVGEGGVSRLGVHHLVEVSELSAFEGLPVSLVC